MKVAIAGAGSVGTAIASDLHAGGHDVLVIEQDPDLVARIRGDLDITWVVADACEVASLDAAGLSTVDVVVAATGDDEDNLVISLLAKQEFAVPRVVARVNHPKNQWLFTESWGVDVSVSTPQLLTALVEEAVSVGSLVRLLRFEGGNAHLVEVTLAEDSPAAGVLPGRPGGAPGRHRGGRGARRPSDRAPRRHPAGHRRRGAGAGHRRRRGCGPAAAGGALTRMRGRLLRPGQDGHRQGVHRRLRPAALPGRADQPAPGGPGRWSPRSSTSTSGPASRSWPGSASRCSC